MIHNWKPKFTKSSKMDSALSNARVVWKENWLWNFWGAQKYMTWNMLCYLFLCRAIWCISRRESFWGWSVLTLTCWKQKRGGDWWCGNPKLGNWKRRQFIVFTRTKSVGPAGSTNHNILQYMLEQILNMWNVSVRIFFMQQCELNLECKKCCKSHTNDPNGEKLNQEIPQSTLQWCFLAF